jgi:predicted acyltransferase
VARSDRERLLGLLGAGVAVTVLGKVMGLWFPINKALWSSSYAVFTGGAALISFGVCYWLIDIEGYRRWTPPFVIFGTNPIIAYFCSSLAGKALELMLVTMPDGANIPVKRYLFEEVFLRLASPETASLLFAFVNLLLWLGLTAILYRNRVFIKV